MKINKNKQLNVRQSNFELMRIISMIFIVLYHILVHGKILEHSTGAIEIILIFLESLILVHVNSFILITGYFQSQSNMKLSRALSINNMTWFYKVVIMVILINIGLISSPDLITRIRTYLPIDYGTYWFIDNYLILYLISPILNQIINTSNKERLRKILFILFIIISLASTISRDVYFNSEIGRSLSVFILLYFMGAYIRKYPINTSYFMKPFTKEAKKLIYLSLYILFAVVSTFCWVGYIQFMSIDNAIIKSIGEIFGYMHISYASPIIILETIFYFLFFENLKVKSKFINIIASCTLAVYLISENIFIRDILYNLIGIIKIKTVNIKIIFYIIILTITIFILCIIIELIRRLIFDKIYKSKVACQIRKKYQNYFKSLGFNINW